ASCGSACRPRSFPPRRSSDLPMAAAHLTPTGAAGWRVIAGVTAFAMLAAVLGVAVGVLLRNTAGAVAVLLLWPLVAEPILANMRSEEHTSELQSRENVVCRLR